MKKIFHLVYRSSAREDLDRYSILNIINKAQMMNDKAGLTGLLIYRQNTFIQLLEGDEKTVKEVYAKIVKDRRHSDVKVLIESKSSMRIVPQFSMNYVESLSEDASIHSLFEVFEQMVSESPKDKNLIMPLLTKLTKYSNLNI